jgi:hypothetical protein
VLAASRAEADFASDYICLDIAVAKDEIKPPEQKESSIVNSEASETARLVREATSLRKVL